MAGLGRNFLGTPAAGRMRRATEKRQRRDGTRDVGVVEPSRIPTPEQCADEQMRCFAELIGDAVVRHQTAGPGAAVKPPEWICPPARAIDWDAGIQPTTDYTVLAAGAAPLVIAEQRLNPYHAGSILGFAWTVAWNAGTAGNPALSCPVTLRINGIAHQAFQNMTRQPTSSCTVMRGCAIFIPTNQSGQAGALIQLVATNTHATDSVRVDGRMLGYQWMPEDPVGEGVDGARVRA